MDERPTEELVFYPCCDDGDLGDPEVVNEMTEAEASEHMRLVLAKRFVETLGLDEDLLGDVKEWVIVYNMDDEILYFKFPNDNRLKLTLESYKNANYIERVQGMVMLEQIVYDSDDFAGYTDGRIVSIADTERLEYFCEFIATDIHE